MKQLIRIKKIIFRAFFFIFYPERCVPRAIRYDNQQWYLSEGKQDDGTGRMATEVSYIGFKGNETIYLITALERCKSAAYRQMHIALWELGVF